MKYRLRERELSFFTSTVSRKAVKLRSRQPRSGIWRMDTVSRKSEKSKIGKRPRRDSSNLQLPAVNTFSCFTRTHIQQRFQYGSLHAANITSHHAEIILVSQPKFLIRSGSSSVSDDYEQGLEHVRLVFLVPRDGKEMLIIVRLCYMCSR